MYPQKGGCNAFDNSHLKLDKKIRKKLKNSTFDGPLIVNQTFCKNWICYWQIRFCTYYAFSFNQMSDVCKVWKYWPLKDDFCSISQKFLQGHFVVGGPKNFKLLADISFESGLQNTALPSLMLFLCSCYYVDLDDIQWNEVATSTVRNFNNSWPLYLIFLNMINLCPNIWFIKNSKCQQFFHLKKEPSKKH